MVGGFLSLKIVPSDPAATFRKAEVRKINILLYGDDIFLLS